MATDIKALGDQIVGLTLLEAKALADYLKETHGIEAAAGGAVVMAASPVWASRKLRTWSKRPTAWLRKQCRRPTLKSSRRTWKISEQRSL